MSTPTPFELGRDIGSNISSGIRSAAEQRSLERILSQIQQGNNPENIASILQRFSPERQQIAMNAISQRNKQRAYQSQGLDPSLSDLDPAIQKEILKNRDQNSSQKNSAQQSIGLIQRAREIAKTGHLGPKIGVLGTGRNFLSTFSKEGQRLRSEYQQLGKALVQAAAPLKITNRAEFQHYAKGLEDPTRSLEEISGSLDALERIILESMGGYPESLEQNYIDQKSQATGQSEKQASRPPLDSFYR